MTPVYVHVNRHKILSNRKTAANEPCVAVRRGRNGKATYVEEAELVDEQGRIVARLVRRPEQKLKCGAEVWLEVYPDQGIRVRPRPCNNDGANCPREKGTT